MHDEPEAVVVVDRVVLHAAVVPESDGMRLPDKATGEFRLDLVFEQEAQQWRAFFVGHPLDPGGVRNIDVKRLATGLRMGPHHRVLGAVFFRRLGLAAFLDPVFAGLADICLGRAADADQEFPNRGRFRCFVFLNKTCTILDFAVHFC